MPRETPNVVHLASPDDIEQQFYEALQQGDLARLMSVWADDDHVCCVHPGGPRLVGLRDIRASFEGIFAHGGVPVQAHDVQRVTSHATAVHSVLERVQAVGDHGPVSAWVVATNVYLKTAQGWRLVAHHASPASPADGPGASAAAGASATLH